ncbi:hypothetical protein KK137_15150 [Croceibacterium sp. LX-88]|jgi:hypothetical protein|uniref:Type II toxin-antitoxin system HicB family antitoxin n=1 Tax=Croceibacterium selenioxidans TaxID=2838833 RepID=A0ABS5W8Z0_9SPHN|nr:hypothetical protein [Croceibacterium selenioxidans]MBT2135675.1 hypothetical protein [Croceibacterium selenioxidans]
MSGVIFSLKDGEVWASWPDDPGAVRLGEVAEVAAMMRDFLQQLELGERLNRQHRPSE